jgi:DNA polymerase IV (DinB-like DNA polymerase)
MADPDPRRIILHLDMDSFYASVEMQRNPSLQGKAVIIGADPKKGTGRGVVLTCSYEARHFGVRSAMPVSVAYTLCPQAFFLPPDFPAYLKASADVMTLLRSSGFRFQQVSIDEAFLDLSSTGDFNAATSVAEELQESIKTRMGLTCSIGLAPCKLVAKIASDFKKPAGLTVVEPETTREFLAPLPVRKIPGIGGKSELALHELGISTIGDLASYDVGKLVAKFGRSAVSLHEAALGIDRREVEEHGETRSISREITFETDTSDPVIIISTIDALAEDVFAGLIQEDLSFRTMTVKVRYQGFITRTRARTLSHGSRKKEALKTGVRTLVREMIDDRKIRLLGIRLSSLEKPDAGQRRLEI